MFAVVNVIPNQGYSADQVSTSITLARLRDEVQEAIDEWGEDVEVVTFDAGAVGGAKYGKFDFTFGIESRKEMG